MNTREKILLEALRLFSQRGYDAVSVEQIAQAVGIRAPSLYKHYKGKQDIFDAILAETAQRYAAFADGISVHTGSPQEDRQTFAQLTADVLVEKLRALVAYSLHDEFVCQLRRMLTIEQFRSPELSALYSQRYVQQLHDYHTALFARLMDAGFLRREDPALLAMLYDAPVFVALGECDRHPEREEELMRQLEAHVRLFVRTFGIPQEERPEGHTEKWKDNEEGKEEI